MTNAYIPVVRSSFNPHEVSKSKKSRPQVILFDWDDTLVSTWPMFYDIYRRIFEKYNTVLPDSETLHEIAVRHGRQTFARLLPQECAKDALQEAMSLYEVESKVFLFPMEHAEKMLQQCYEWGIPMGIVSNKAHDLLLEEVARCGWTHYFVCITGCCIAGAKPSPKPIFHTLNTMNLAPSKHVWFVGDSLVDHEAAVAASCFSVHFGGRHQEAELTTTHWEHFLGVLSKKNFKNP